MKQRLLVLLTVFFPLMGFGFESLAKPVVTRLKMNDMPPGSIVIVARERNLYLVSADGQSALRYRVAVPQPSMMWTGTKVISEVKIQPDWQAPEIVRRAKPNLPPIIRGGDPSNPMGVGAMILGSASEELAIHGTAPFMRKTMGQAASFGCIRMLNEDWEDLASRVGVGTSVTMIR